MDEVLESLLSKTLTAYNDFR